MTCLDCERYKQSASMWRNKAYELNGTPLPWKPHLDKGRDYEEGFIDGMQHQMQSSVDKAVNGMAQPKQEPVAWNVIDPMGKIVATEENAIRGWARVQGYKPTVEALLAFHEQGWRVVPTTTPPQRTWVGLTSVDWNDFNAVKGNDPQYVAQWAEAKLKEKNT